jgi:hypothetical protein
LRLGMGDARRKKGGCDQKRTRQYPIHRFPVCCHCSNRCCLQILAFRRPRHGFQKINKSSTIGLFSSQMPMFPAANRLPILVIKPIFNHKPVPRFSWISRSPP